MHHHTPVAADTPFHPLPDRPEFCMVCPGFLTPAECAEFIAQSERRGFAGAGSDYPPSYRNNDRQVLDDADLAARLLERLRRHAPATLPGEPGGPEWALHAVNERFRLCRYRPGQRFGIHQDGVHHRDADTRSRLTFMVYLTDGDDFAGGDTLFHAAGPGRGDADDQGPPPIARVRPRAGSLILFDHALWHSGETVTAGVKHILRSDLLYRCDSRQAPLDGMPFQPGHRGYIWTLARLAEGLLASGGRDTEVRLWHDDGRPVRSLTGHRQSVLGLAALPDRRLASVSRDRSLRIWDWAFGSCDRVVAAHEAAALTVAALPGGMLATGGADAVVKLWTGDGDPVRTLTGHRGWVWEVSAFGDCGLASASEDGNVRLWDRRSGECRHTLPGDVPLRTLLIQPDGRRLVTGDIRGDMVVWERSGPGWRRERRHRAHGAAIRRLRMLDNGGIVASAGEDDQVRLWRWPSLEAVSVTGHGSFATDVLATPNGCLSCAYDGQIRRIDLPPALLHPERPNRSGARMAAPVVAPGWGGPQLLA